MKIYAILAPYECLCYMVTNQFGLVLTVLLQLSIDYLEILNLVGSTKIWRYRKQFDISLTKEHSNLLDRQILVVLTIFLYYFTALQVYQKFKNSIFYLFIFRTYNFCLFIKQLYCKKMASPALKDLPKVDSDLKSQLEGFKSNRLSHTETKEKVILPSAEGE